MIRIISLILSLLLLTGKLSAQSGYNSALVKAGDADIAEGWQSSEQLRLWEQKSNADKKDAQAWYSRFIWEQRERGMSAARMEMLAEEAGKYIKGTYFHELMLYHSSDNSDAEALSKAYELCPDKQFMYPYMIQHYTDVGDAVQVAGYCRLMDAAKPLAPDSADYFYHVNVLMSAENNANIYLNGMKDLSALAVLQQVYGIRKDITLKYYRDTVIQETGRPGYLSLSLGKEVISRYKNNSVYTGLLVRLNAANSNDELLRHYSTFKLSYLRSKKYFGAEAKMNMNYLPACLQLYRYYLQDNPAEANTLKQMIIKLADEAGVQDKIALMLKEIEEGH